MSFGYNTQFKKDAAVTKLKNIQELKEVQQKTRLLETDKKKMEERVHELKVVMETEKDNRGKRMPDGNFWASGTDGPLKNHAHAVLAQNNQDISKVKKIVLLKDEPIAESVTSKSATRPPPGTLAHIAKRSAFPQPKAAGSVRQNVSCGQCETQSATMQCRECGENFCRSCFASFHVRGALRGHHPVLLNASANGKLNEIPPSPKVSFEKPLSGGSGGSTPKGNESISRKVKVTSDANTGPSPSNAMIKPIANTKNTTDSLNSPASTSFDIQSTARSSFADEWAAAVNAVASQLVNQTTKKYADAPIATETQSMFNVTTKRSTSSSGTNTSEQIPAPVSEVITFSSTGISYKDRLLLNKYRRFELPPATGQLIPKPPATPSGGARRLRQSREGTFTKVSVDPSSESLMEHLSFEEIEKEMHRVENEGILIVSGRPGSAVTFGSSRWQNALETEFLDDEVMLETSKYSRNSESKNESDLKLFDSVELFEDEVLQINDFAEIIESARPAVPEEPAAPPPPNDNSSTSPTDTVTIKSRPNSSRPVSAAKKPDQLKKAETKSRKQASSEYGPHRISVLASRELKRVATSFSEKKPSPRPVSARKVAGSKTEIGASPAKVNDFLLIGVESQSEDLNKTPRPSSARSSKHKIAPGIGSSYTVFRISSNTWKPFNSMSLEATEQISQETSEKSMAAWPAIEEAETKPQSPAVLKMRFPFGERSASQASVDKSIVDDEDDITPRNSGVGFLGRMAIHKTDMRIESASTKSHILPAEYAAAPSPRQNSLMHGYAQKRTPLQQSIEAWRASHNQNETNDEVEKAENVISSAEVSSEDEVDEGFKGRLVTISSSRSKSTLSNRIEPEESELTPRRPKSSQVLSNRTPRNHMSLSLQLGGDDDDGDQKTELDENDAETLRSLGEELRFEISQSRDATLELHAEETDITLDNPVDSSSLIAMGMSQAEDPMETPGRQSVGTASILNEDDDFDDKMALAELASELQLATSSTTSAYHHRSAGQSHNATAVNRVSGSLANLLHGSAGQSQVTTTSLTSCWSSSSPSNSGSVNATNHHLPVLAEDAGVPIVSSTSPGPSVSKPKARSRGSGLVFNTRDEFAIRQSSLMGDFDDMEKQFNGEEEEEDEDDY